MEGACSLRVRRMRRTKEKVHASRRDAGDALAASASNANETNVEGRRNTLGSSSVEWLKAEDENHAAALTAIEGWGAATTAGVGAFSAVIGRVEVAAGAPPLTTLRKGEPARFSMLASQMFCMTI